MLNPTFIRGTVRVDGSDAGLSSAEVWLGVRLDRRFRRLQTTTTSANGRFAFDLQASSLNSKQQRYEVQVLQDGERLAITEGTTQWRVGQDPGDLVLSVTVPEATPLVDDPVGEPPVGINVRGRIRHADGTPASGVWVRALHLSLTGEVLLGATEENEDGNYEVDADGVYVIPYTAVEGGTQLFIRVLLPNEEEEVDPEELAVSPVTYNAGEQERIDLEVEDDRLRSQSEFAKLHGDLGPLLSGSEVDSLTTHGVGVLAGRSGHSIQKVTHYVAARRIARKLHHSGDFSDTDVEAIYGLLRAGFSANPGRLAATHPHAIRHALTRMGRRNLVSKEVVDAQDEVVETLQNALMARALHPATPGGLGKLLAVTSLSTEQKQAFLQLHTHFTGKPAVFWQRLAELSLFTDVFVEEVRCVFQLSAITLNHPPLIQAFRTAYGTGPARIAATLTEENWATLIDTEVDGDPIGFPPGVRGENDTEKRSNYLKLLQQRCQQCFPSAHTAAGLSRDFPDLVSHLAAHPELDFAKDRLTDVGDVEVQKQLRKHQRLYRISPVENRYAVMKALHDAGIHSAHQITRLGWRRFVRRHGASLGGAKVARKVFAKAQAHVGMAMATYTSLHPVLRGAGILGSILPGSYSSEVEAALQDAIPEYADLFGGLSVCACEECRSIHGPAAYYVDLLHWINIQDPSTLDPEGDGPPAYGEMLQDLFTRRPDLETLALSCENTTRTLPYIDLVLEILENGVPGVTPIPHDSTGMEADDLASGPEYVNDAAYDALKTAVFPLSLPFSLHLTQSRAFLKSFGINRAELMRTLQIGDVPSDRAIAYEILGLEENSAKLILRITDDDPWALWGFAAEVNASIPWHTSLSNLREFRRRANVNWEQVLDLLQTRFLNGDGHLSVLDTGSDPDAWSFNIVGSAADRFEKIRQFLRLWRTLDWSILEVDKMLSAFDWSSLTPSEGEEENDSILPRLAWVRWIQNHSDRSPTELASWWGTLDTVLDRDTRSEPVLPLYDRIFLDPSRNPSTSLADSPFLLNEGRTELANTSPTIADQAAAIQAALGLESEGFAAALDNLKTDPGADGGATPTLTLNNLSRLYRLASFSRTLRLSVRDTLFLISCMGANPFEEPASAWQVIEQARMLREAGWSLDMVRYVIAQDTDARCRIAPTNDWFISTLGRVRDAVRALKTSMVLLVDDADGTLCEQYVEQVKIPGSTTADLMEIIRGTVTGDSWDTLQSALGNYLDADDAQTKLIGAGSPPNVGSLVGADRCSWVLNQILFRLKAGELVQTFFAALLKVDPAVLSTMRSESLGFLSPHQDWATPFAAFDFLAVPETTLATPWADIVLDGSAFEAAFQTTEYLYKLATLVIKLNLSVDEVTWLCTQTGGENLFGTLVLQNLPVDALSLGALPAAWTTFVNTRDLFALRTQLPGTEPSFTALLTTLATDTIDNFTSALVTRTAWDVNLLREMASEMGFVSTPASLQNVSALTNYVDALAIARKTGAAAADVVLWRTAAPGATEADSILLALRSRYSAAASWRSMIQPIRDHLREQQRQALVAFHLASDASLKDELDLYAKYLIDVEMCSCMQTARLKQATAAVQLYVQRVMLNLETGVAFEMDDDLREQWAWMKHYRLWEAARTVFLYPENWLEPELRDDKSELFKQLESVLHQGEITDEKVEEAMLGYLDQLRTMSNLQPLALYHQKDQEDDGEEVDIVHVFARTRNTPYAYYYRRFESQIWTPWEKVAVDVQGSHLLPVVYERRLFLFWAEFRYQQNEADETRTDYTISLCWSEYRNGTWSTRQIGNETIPAVQYSVNPSYPEEVRLRLTADSVGIQIDCFHDEPSDQTDGKQKYGWLGTFTVDTCVPSVNVSLVSANIEVEPLMGWDSEWDAWYQGWRLASSLTPLMLPFGTVYTDGEINQGTDVTTNLVLESPSAGTNVVTPSQYENFVSQDPFFVTTENTVFMVIPNNPWLTTELTPFSLTSPAPGAGTSSTNPDFYGSEDQSASTIDWSAAVEKTNKFSNAKMKDQLRIAADTLSDTNASHEDASAQVANQTPLDVYDFQTFYHPFLCTFIKEVRRGGVMALLSPEDTAAEDAAVLARQGLRNLDVLNSYGPSTAVQGTVDETIEFNLSGSYASYNWEIFYHLPWLIADRLSTHQQYEDADRWYRTILDPTCTNTAIDTPQRYWKVRPLMADPGEAVTNWLAFTGADADANGQPDYEAQVGAWMDDPFNPHLLARLRSGVYQKTIFMKYLDNLIAWGDSLFAQDTMESVNEAAQLYVYARQLLGERPQEVTPKDKPASQSFGDLFPTLDEFSNALVTLLDYTPEPQLLGAHRRRQPVLPTSAMMTSYFCIPSNKKLLSYWKTVDDRLFKIRHCMNLSGVVRSLALYEPPIDPALLVRASAMGVDLRTVLSGLNLGRPPYRFTVMLQRAQAFAGTVRSFGGALLSALEKKDAEVLSVLRSSHEVALLADMEAVKKQQVAEAEASLEAAKQSITVTQGRLDYYQKLMDVGLLPQEEMQDSNLADAQNMQNIASGIQLVGNYLALIPQFGATGIPYVEFGGEQLSKAANFYGSYFSYFASQSRNDADRNATRAGRTRRRQEWRFQRDSAKRDLTQVQKQIVSAEIRVEIAKGELKNHQKQQEQARNVGAWLEHKYTNAELYQWMEEQLCSVYYQAYKLAFDTARKAEVCYNYELGRSDSFIQYGYWNSARKGLLAGELLGHDIDRMDAAYLDNDVREFELVKHVSLAQLDPVALQMLKSSDGDNPGECWFELPEVLFDADCPGHYYRRIQSVAVSLACVAGPQGTVNAELRLHGHAIRSEPPATGFSALTLESAGLPSIVTSVAVNDAGLFNADPRDSRYLPFERRGVVSRWGLRLTAQAWKQFDWDSLTDVTLHLRYTARDGGATARSVVEAALPGNLELMTGGSGSDFAGDGSSGVPVLLSAKRDAPDAWYQVQHATAETMVFTIKSTMLPAIEGMSVKGLMVVPVGAGASAPVVTASAGTLGAADSGSAGSVTFYTMAISDFTPDAVGETLSISFTFAPDTSFATLSDVLLILLQGA